MTIKEIHLEENQIALKCFDRPLHSSYFDNSVVKHFPPKTIKFLDYEYSYGRARHLHLQPNE